MIIVNDFLCGGFYFRYDINIKIIVDIEVECYVNALFTAKRVYVWKSEEKRLGGTQTRNYKASIIISNLLILDDISPR